ncbi:MAG: A/G-specific adenine glycosylase [Desulfobacterales bacterium]
MSPDEIRRFRLELISWYDKARRRLPWRESADPYRIWVSEVMLQQTQVRTVIPYYERFIRRFPSIAEMAAADLEEVLKQWEGLGYYGRARNLHKAARRLVQQGDSRVPEDPDRFRKLPGVGPYIGRAVLSIAFGRPLAVVDGNVKRVLSRLLLMKAPVNLPASDAQFQKAADRLLDPENPGIYNQAMMELGALICGPRAPRCGECPVRCWCRAGKSGSTAMYPVRVGRKAVPEIQTVTAAIYRRGRILVTRRPESGLLGGLWELPGGPREERETPEASCARLVKAATGLSPSIEKNLGTIRHAYTHFRVVATVIVCRSPKGRVTLDGPTDFRWIHPDAAGDLPFPALQRKVLARLADDG